jgi:GNAT superfamily N-acetyltransferase
MEIRPARPEEFDALGQLTLEAYRTVGEWGDAAWARLTRAAIERSREAGAATMVLHSATNMTDAHRLYGRLGFRRDEALDWVPEPDVALLGFRLAL